MFDLHRYVVAAMGFLVYVNLFQERIHFCHVSLVSNSIKLKLTFCTVEVIDLIINAKYKGQCASCSI